MVDLVLSLDAAKLHLRVDSTAEDDLISDAIAAAQGWIEDNTVLILTPRTVTETADDLGRGIALRSWPVTSITSISYFDRTGVQQQLAAGSWYVNIATKPPVRLVPSIGTRWPASAMAPGSVIITMQAGFATIDDVPALVVQALKLLVTHFYTNRNAVEVGTRAAAVEVPLTARDLVNKWRRRLI